MVALTEVQRTFEALQRGVSMFMNEIDAAAQLEALGNPTRLAIYRT